MPRHTLQPLPRAYRPFGGREGARRDEGMWSSLDRVQVLGGDDGHTGCVNALSWSDDGRTLLSGSDDTRICIWQPDSSSSSSSSASSFTSPHPLKLADSIQTGHRANIFSAKFLPNSNTPTIVSCAGDREVRVMDVERLVKSPMTGELDGRAGDGVTVLRCHKDRTKRIATENSPSLFLTVSEDGTVRQHDLRRPHTCRSECPDPLFYAPRGVDLYSLSVSTVTPHVFAVAGRTDCAFVCDRRMLPRQKPSWGHNIRSSGQVHCVRRLGLPSEEWDKVSPRSGDRVYGDERHVTCVKMSPEHADEVAVSFARHSTSLFSTYDSPPSTSTRARSSSPTIVPPNQKPKSSVSKSPSSPPAVLRNPPSPPPGPPSSFIPASDVPPRPEYRPKVGSDDEMDGHSTPSLGKRRISDRSSNAGDDGQGSRQRTHTPPMDQAGDEDQSSRTPVTGSIWPFVEPHNGISTTPSRRTMLEEGDDVDVSDLRGTLESAEFARVPAQAEQSRIGPRTPPAGYRAEDFLREDDQEDDEHGPAARQLRAEAGEDATMSDLEEMALDLLNQSDSESDNGFVTDEEQDPDDDLDEDGEADADDDDADGLEVDEDDFDGPDEDDDMDMDMDTDVGILGFGGSNASNLKSGAFDDVDMIVPRRSFRGARNVETVKDCNFLGTRADKICSGSDDGNFFVWDKETGRLEGIWEGDGSVVNVMEQHPTLPLVAVSGIDNTVKMFAPTSIRTTPSFSRTHLSESIIERNTRAPRFLSGGAFERATLLQFLMSRGLVVQGDDEEVDAEGDGQGPDTQSCQTQ